jgi:hypothetical protein
VSTVYDWLTVGMFAGLIVLFLQRSTEQPPRDTLWHYAPPALGCAIGNQLGNEGMHVLAVLVLLAIGAYTVIVLKPFRVGPNSGDWS